MSARELNGHYEQSETDITLFLAKPETAEDAEFLLAHT